MSTPPVGDDWWSGPQSGRPPHGPAVTLTPPPPPLPAPEPAKKTRRVKPWMWVVGAVVLIGLGILAAPMIALATLVVLITGIVALAKGTPTWLGFRSRRAAVVATSLAAVGFMVFGTITSATQAAQGEDSTDAAPVATSEPVPFVASDPATTAEPASATMDEWQGGGAPPVDSRTAVEVLATLEVKGRAPKTGYSRDMFGPAWADVDQNGCDTRNDILRRDLTGIATDDGCTIASGVLFDPYTAGPIDFERGPETSAAVQIDHVVALGDAWQKGAQQLSDEARLILANDPLNLLAVSGPANLQKGDGDAATWLPRSKPFRCEYVARQVSVKAAYRLWVTQAEHDAIARILGDCPDQDAYLSLLAPDLLTAADAAAPVVDAPVPPPAAPAPPAQPAPAPPQPAPAPPQPAPAPPAAVYYANCTAVRAAGAAPLYAGQPGYSNKLDRDGDGVACET